MTSKEGRFQSVPDSINGILPSPTWLCYEKVNMYLYDGTDGNRHLFYASDAKKYGSAT